MKEEQKGGQKEDGKGGRVYGLGGGGGTTRIREDHGQGGWRTMGRDDREGGRT